MEGTSARLPVADVRRYVRDAGERAAVPEDQIDLFVSSFVDADLRGVETHGIARIPAYVRAFLEGIINPAPSISVLHDNGASLHVDADNGLGMVVGQLAMDKAVERAARFGVGAVSVRNSNHAGMLAIHVLRATSHGMLGFFTSGGVAIMPAWGGADQVLGNGPFAWGMPNGSSFPVVVDMASSVVARGKIRSLAMEGKPIPEGWALDSEGHPTRDASAAMRGVVLPMAGHKGSGLAVALEIVSSVLSGSSLAVDAPRDFLREGARTLDSWRIGHFALALNPDAFAGSDAFDEILGRLKISITDSRRAAGVTRIVLPGQIEAETQDERLRSGIPISSRVLESLNNFAEEIGIRPISQ